MNFFEELQWRGLVKDVTDKDGLANRLQQSITCYCGFDPTADSLHIGHLQQIMLLKRYQKAGHRPIALCGGTTGMIGDPRMTSERKLLTLEQVAYNAECIKKQLAMFLDFEGENAAIMENNYNWLSNMLIVDYLRDFGKCFSVSYMLAKDTVASRLETGISYTEFSYMILQSIDFLQLFDTYKCQLQIGGSDQWGNLTSGVELIRKLRGEDAKVFGVTSPLITKSDGSKFGKSEGKNIWLDPTKTGPYEFYQFFVNIADNDIIYMLKRLSMKAPEEIMALEESLKAEPHLRKAQKALAEELTEMVHGKEGLESALKITEALFTGDVKQLTAEQVAQAFKNADIKQLEANTPIVDALVNCGAASSKREAREFLKNGSISINGEKEQNMEKIITTDDTLDGSTVVIKRGKKNYYIVKL